MKFLFAAIPVPLRTLRFGKAMQAARTCISQMRILSVARRSQGLILASQVVLQQRLSEYVLYTAADM